MDRINGTGPLRITPAGTGPLQFPPPPPPPVAEPAAPQGPVDAFTAATGAISALQARDAALEQELQAAGAGISDPTQAFLAEIEAPAPAAANAEGRRDGEDDDPIDAANEMVEHGRHVNEWAERGVNAANRIRTGMEAEESAGTIARNVIHGAMNPEAAEAAERAVAGGTLQIPHPNEKVPSVFTGVTGVLNLGGGAVTIASGARDLAAGARELQEGDVVSGTGHVVAGALNVESGTLTMGQGALEVGSLGARIAGNANLMRSMSAGASELEAVAGPIGAAAGLISGGVDVYQGLTSTPPNYEQAAIGGLEGAAGVAMLFPPVGTAIGTAINVGIMIYQNWDTVCNVAHEAVEAVEHVGEAVEHAAESIVEGLGHLIGL